MTSTEDVDYADYIARRDAILNTPEVAEIVKRARDMTDEQRTALYQGWLAHYRIYRLGQSELWHRYAKAVPRQQWRDLLAATEEVGNITRQGRPVYHDEWGADHAVEDAVKAVVIDAAIGLSDAEKMVYTAPWRSVFEDLPA